MAKAGLEILELDEVEIPIVVEVSPARGARAFAWLGVAVSWLTTTALALLIGTSLPAHLHSAPASRAAASSEEPASPPPAVAAAATASALAGPPLVSVEDLPVAKPRALSSTCRNAEPNAEPKTMRPFAPGPITAARASSTPAVVRAKVAPAKPSSPLTLEEAIRREVAAEQARALKH